MKRLARVREEFLERHLLNRRRHNVIVYLAIIQRLLENVFTATDN
jgi:hypothetical protein